MDALTFSSQGDAWGFTLDDGFPFPPLRMDVRATLADKLCSIALQAKAAYEAAYESAELRGGAELTANATGALDSASTGDVALHAITQCEWVIEQCRGVPSASQHAQALLLPQPASTSAATASIDDEMPDWLQSAANDLAPPIRSASFERSMTRRKKRTPKTGD